MFPMRYNPMRFVLQKRLKSQTTIDPVFGSAIGKIKEDSQIELQGQVNLVNKKFFTLDPTKIGDDEKTNGKIFIKKAHYTTIIEKGDKIIEFGPISDPTKVNAMVKTVKGIAPLRGNFLFMVIEFTEDREGHST